MTIGPGLLAPTMVGARQDIRPRARGAGYGYLGRPGRLRPLSASAAVQGITPSGSNSFSFGSHADTAVLNLKIAHPGRFLLQARAPAAPAGSHVAVGSSVGGSLARIIVPFIALIVVGVCGVVAVGFSRGSRGSRGRRLALARVAEQYGMQYSEDDPYGLPAPDFRLLLEGNPPGCPNR